MSNPTSSSFKEDVERDENGNYNPYFLPDNLSVIGGLGYEVLYNSAEESPFSVEKHKKWLKELSILSDENGNYIQPEFTSKELKQQLRQLHTQFLAAGKNVKEVTDKRAELHKDLDWQEENLLKLQVADQESGLDDIDENDPLRFIESDYPFFQSDRLCMIKEMKNVEDPQKCLAAMDKFVQIIQDNVHRFKHLPKGPLYKDIMVKNRKWAPLAEYVLRAYLFTFLVDNIVDSLVIEELIAEHFPGSRCGVVNRDGVVCPTFHIFPYHKQIDIDSRITAVSNLELENMLESIHFNEEIWGKFLSERMSIEKIVFMENENAAFVVMSHIKSTPWHCKYVYTLDGFCVHPFPCFRTKAIKFHSRPVYLKCIPNTDIMDLEMKIRKINEKICGCNMDIVRLRELQLELANQLDEVGVLYDKAKAKEKQDGPKNKKKAKF